MRRQSVTSLKTVIDSAIEKNQYDHIIIRAAMLKGGDELENFLFSRVDYSKGSERPKDDVLD